MLTDAAASRPDEPSQVIPYGEGFPVDDYTPHGYLDVPTHTRKLTPQGVVRSCDVGFRWHFPALATGYGGRSETYRAGLRIGVDGASALTDFDAVNAPYHSKDIVEFHGRRGGAAMNARFHLAGPHVLVARISGRCHERLTVRMDYLRHLGADQGWGESGLVGRHVNGVTVLKGFEDGEAFVMWASHSAAGYAVTADTETADRWATAGIPAAAGTPAAPVTPRPTGTVAVTGDRGDLVGLVGVLDFPGERHHDLTVLLARGRTEDEALRRLAAARERHQSILAEKRVDDARFWATAPRLSGDWPAHWRRGLVYDLETLRMMVKPPVGRYTHPWDAMQIHAPRVVLGEAAIDAMLLGYADPRLAQLLMLGTFADAVAPNVPCSREDGSLNMVSADGSPCGTGPQWGYPWLVVRRLYEMNPDNTWLDALYPKLAAYLDWWLAHRRDGDGWLVHACSWESGQDLSPRFGEQPLGGGHPTYHIRPVDLQASFAHAAATMADFAAILGRTRDEPGWRRVAAEYAERTAQLWTGSRYADVDSRAGTVTDADRDGVAQQALGGRTAASTRPDIGLATDVDDVMLWAPAALGLAAPARVAALRPAIRTADPDALVWPMFVWTAVEAALAAGENETAAAIAGGVVDRAYRFWDAPRQEPGRTLPGVSCEYWPTSGRCGGEGYGWGAFGVHLVIGVLAGIRVTSDRIARDAVPGGAGTTVAGAPRGDTAGGRLAVRPNLPADLRIPGRRYDIRLICRDTPVTVTLRPLDDGVRVNVCTAGDDDGLGRDLAWGEEASWDLPR